MREKIKFVTWLLFVLHWRVLNSTWHSVTQPLFRNSMCLADRHVEWPSQSVLAISTPSQLIIHALFVVSSRVQMIVHTLECVVVRVVFITLRVLVFPYDP